MLGGLNGDLVLWLSLGAVAASFIALVAWGIKAFRSMEGMDSNN